MFQAAQGAVRLEGDVITANGSILSGQYGQVETISLDDEASVCSCRCTGFYNRPHKQRFTVRRSPGKISHLLPMQPLVTGSSIDDDTPDEFYHNLTEPQYTLRPPSLAPLLQLPPIYQHRASI